MWIDPVSHYVARRLLPTRTALWLSPTPTRSSTHLDSQKTSRCEQQCPRKCQPDIWSVGAEGGVIVAEVEDAVWCFMHTLNFGMWYLCNLALNELSFS